MVRREDSRQVQAAWWQGRLGKVAPSLSHSPAPRNGGRQRGSSPAESWEGNGGMHVALNDA